MQQVFVYGSLLFSEVTEALTGRVLRTKEGTLPDFKRFAVSGADYPAVIPCTGVTVTGKVLEDVDDRSLEILRFYEGDEYECISAGIQVSNEKTKALVFVWKGETERLNGNWDENRFKESLLEFYIREVAPETLRAFEALRT